MITFAPAIPAGAIDNCCPPYFLVHLVHPSSSLHCCFFPGGRQILAMQKLLPTLRYFPFFRAVEILPFCSFVVSTSQVRRRLASHFPSSLPTLLSLTGFRILNLDHQATILPFRDHLITEERLKQEMNGPRIQFTSRP